MTEERVEEGKWNPHGQEKVPRCSVENIALIQKLQIWRQLEFWRYFLDKYSAMNDKFYQILNFLYILY